MNIDLTDRQVRFMKKEELTGQTIEALLKGIVILIVTVASAVYQTEGRHVSIRW